MLNIALQPAFFAFHLILAVGFRTLCANPRANAEGRIKKCCLASHWNRDAAY